MSRNLKRVPLDFAWPLKKTWSGYSNHYYKLATACPDCIDGYDCVQGRPNANAALFFHQWYGHAFFDPVAYGAEPLSIFEPAIWRLAKHNCRRQPDNHGAIGREVIRLFDMWRGQWNHHLLQADVDALIADKRLMDFTHRPRSDEHLQQLAEQDLDLAGTPSHWLEESNGYRPTAAEVNVWSLEGVDHDSVNMDTCVKARCAREGVPSRCTRCNGSATLWPSAEIEQLYESWEPSEPPTGEGYQLWENTSEGSPISPVFDTLESLCAWAAIHATTYADFTATAEQWREMLVTGTVHIVRNFDGFNAVFT